jgi:hypothetical protein
MYPRRICLLFAILVLWSFGCTGKVSVPNDGGQDAGFDAGGDSDVSGDGDSAPDGGDLHTGDGDDADGADAGGGDTGDQDPPDPVCPNGVCEPGEDAASCVDCAQCPNGEVEAGEDCDGPVPAGFDCQRIGFESGQLACGGDCLWDTSGCIAASGQCNDGVDNDQDGLTDWQMDMGCYSASDDTEGSPNTQDRQDGWTVFEASPDSRLVYVSSSTGDDGRDGSSPDQAVLTLARGMDLVRDGQHDFLLLRRGDAFRDVSFGRFKSGLDGDRRLVVASFGDSTERPRLEVSSHALNHDGHPRSYLAFVGLEINSYTMDPDHPSYSGDNVSGGFRLVGSGDDILIEDCRFQYCELVVQSYGGDQYRNVEVRRNIISTNYAHGTCPSNNAIRPSGMYSSHVDGLSIVENLWDHNGWNEDVATACATMYNHNMYLSGGHQLVVRGNLILRASSMGIKMRSDSTGDFNDILIEDNLFIEGEIGLGIGGNTSEPLRFVDVVVRNNVFSHISRTTPTGRDFAWLMEMQDNQRALVTGNLFMNQPWHTNTYGLSLHGGTLEDITVEGNWFYGVRQRHLQLDVQAGWQNIQVRDNNYLDTDLGAQLVDHSGSFAQVSYAANHYSSSAAASDWFGIDGSAQSLAQWQAASGEADADTNVPAPPDPNRSLETYCSDVLGLPADLTAFIQEAENQSRHRWLPELSAPVINDYIRAGFGQARSRP